MVAYVIGQLNIHSPDEYQDYLKGFLPIFQKYEGELLATTKRDTEVIEGTWSYPKTVIMRFPSLEAAHSWHSDPEYQELAEIRHRTADTNLVIVEGIA